MNGIQVWQRRLWFLGMLQFTLGLLTGLYLAMAPTTVANPRGLLASHLEAVMNGTFVILCGFLVPHVTLSDKARNTACGLLLYGTFANWFATAVAGIVGTFEATPIAGAGHHAGVAPEKFVLAVLGSVAITMIVAVGIFLAGLRGRGTSTAEASS